MKHKSNRTKIKIDFFIARIARFPRLTSGIIDAKSNRTKIKIDVFIARIARFPRLTSGIMRKWMRKTYFNCFCYGKKFLLFFFFFLTIWYLWPLFQHENNSVDENKLTFTKPLDGSSNNQSCGRDSGLSLKIGIHILSKKLNRKYKCFWCFTWLHW